MGKHNPKQRPCGVAVLGLGVWRRSRGLGLRLVWGLFNPLTLGIVDAAVTNDEQLTVAEELIRPRSLL